MNRGMRHVIGSAALAAVYLLSAAPVFAQLPPWAQQDRQQERRYYGPPPQRQNQQQPEHAQPQRGPEPRHQAQPQRAPEPRPQQQQARPVQPAPVEQQVQQKPKPEPVPQNNAERAACLNKETPQAQLIAACSVIIDSGR